MTTPIQTENAELTWQQFVFVRDEIRFQHTLLGNRLGSYVASQSFFFVAFAISCDPARLASLPLFVAFPFIALPLVAISVSRVVAKAIDAADKRLDIQRALLYRYPDKHNVLPEPQDAEMKSAAKESKLHRESLEYLLKIPTYLTRLWTAILCFGVAYTFVYLPLSIYVLARSAHVVSSTGGL